MDKDRAEAALERAAASHGWLTGNKEDDVIGHQAEDSFHVSCSGRAVPQIDKIANGLFVSAHGNTPRAAPRRRCARIC
jgi:hypothetical protein